MDHKTTNKSNTYQSVDIKEDHTGFYLSLLGLRFFFNMWFPAIMLNV